MDKIEEINSDDFAKEVITQYRNGSKIKYCIYGRNNSGKTTLLEKVYNSILETNIETITGLGVVDTIDTKLLIPSFYIRANRLEKSFENGTFSMPDLNSTYFLEKNEKNVFDDYTFVKTLRTHYLRDKDKYTIINDAIKEMFNIDLNSIDGTDEEKNKKYDLYSDGVRNIINIYCFVYYMYDLYKIESGIVLIDEIELFLYAKSQELFLKILKRAFPNVIFVVTTHSGIIVQRGKFFNYRINEITHGLEKRAPFYYDDLEMVLLSEFELDKYPDEFSSFLDKISKKRINDFSDKDKEEIKEEYKELEEKYPNLTLKIQNIFISCFGD